MREFLPEARPSRWRIPLAVLLAATLAVPLGVLVAMLRTDFTVRYTVRDGALSVALGDPFTGDREVPLSAVREVRQVALGKGSRIAGTSLPGCCTGTWSFPDLGRVWLATGCTREGLVLEIDGQDHPWVLSPPDPEAFTRALTGGGPLEVALPPPDTGPLDWIGFAGLVAIALVGPMGVWLLVQGPGKMRYRVGQGALEVETVFSKKRWPTHGMRARRLRPARPWRLAGSAAPGYYTGWFRLDGATTRVAATRLDEVVLIEGPVRLALTPADPEAFLEALQKAGAVVG